MSIQNLASDSKTSIQQVSKPAAAPTDLKLSVASQTFALADFYWACSRNTNSEVLESLKTQEGGLTPEVAAERLAQVGPNVIAQRNRSNFFQYLYRCFMTPFNILLVSLSILTYTAGGDSVGGSIILGMVVLATLTTLFQEYKSSNAVEKLATMVTNTATVFRCHPAASVPFSHVRDSAAILQAVQETDNSGWDDEEKRSDEAKRSEFDIDVPLEVVAPSTLTKVSSQRVERTDQTLRDRWDPVSSSGAGLVSSKIEIPMQDLVPGDVIHLSAGDMVPADCRLLLSKDLFISQATLTGESMPVEKRIIPLATEKPAMQLFEQCNICFMGTNVVSGTAKAVILATGPKTFFGSLAKSLKGIRTQTSFDKGINGYVYMMLCFMFFTSATVFVIIGASGSGNWMDAFLFAIAIAIGLTPEMLPMIIAVNLAKGAMAMARRKAVVKRLNAIQNFGAMDILCTDKTGTLTNGQVILERYVDITGADSDTVLEYAYLNSYHQTGLKNLVDEAILHRAGSLQTTQALAQLLKVDEVPFDFVRRRMSVVVQRFDKHVLICKGAMEEVVRICNQAQTNGKTESFEGPLAEKYEETTKRLNQEGFRVIAVAYKEFPISEAAAPREYSVKDESEMILLGTCALFDPPRDSAVKAIAGLRQKGITCKVLTGDNEMVSRNVCRTVGIDSDIILLGAEIDRMSDSELADTCEMVHVFSKLTPANKERIVKALQAKDHVVGFLGDGINDAPALRAADVGISVDNAVDIAKESADIILLEKSLLVLQDGVTKGRKVFGNIIKYIKMGASSNFGNVFSMIGATIIFPFIPMQPVQILLQNLIYDMSQTAIPWDLVDAEYTTQPRRWVISDIAKFMLFMGPTSSIFDYSTWAIVWWYYGLPAGTENDNDPGAILFQTIWFVEGLTTQLLVVHVIRSRKIPFLQTRAAWPLIITTTLCAVVGIVLQYTPLAPYIPFATVPVRNFWFPCCHCLRLSDPGATGQKLVLSYLRGQLIFLDLDFHLFLPSCHMFRLILR